MVVVLCPRGGADAAHNNCMVDIQVLSKCKSCATHLYVMCYKNTLTNLPLQLEDRIENYVDQLFGLFKAPTAKPWDIEQGWKRQLTPRENTLRFPLSGKKRS